MTHGCVPRRSTLLACAGAVLVGCGPASDDSACRGLAERTVAITRAEYAPCAAEMLAALDTLERQLDRTVRARDSTALRSARRTYRHLQRLIRQVDFHGDARREVRQGAGRTVERWPEANVRAFNGALITATAQYGAIVDHPNPDNLEEGSRHHRTARDAFARLR